MAMKLRFLGTGTSTGTPVIGCPCPVCHSPHSRDKRLRTSALLTTDHGQHILIDCGPDFRQQALAAGLTHIDAILLTHEHYDHVGGLDDIRPLGDMPVYALQRVLDAVIRCMPYCFGTQKYPGSPDITLHPILPEQPFHAAGQQIIPLSVMHANLPILGFRIGSLAYLTDVKTLPSETMQQLSDLSVLVINALRPEAHPSHLSLPEAVELARTIGAKNTYFTHFAHQIGLHQATEQILPPNMHLAYDGLEIDIH